MLPLKSLPSRERGLKLVAQCQALPTSLVAPFTGAWIEIWVNWSASLVSCVAPFTGAWIEIAYFACRCLSSPVAPFTGAWIEMVTPQFQPAPLSSLPSRERGLKCKERQGHQRRGQSLPSRERGLKLLACVDGTGRIRSLPSRERGLKSED